MVAYFVIVMKFVVITIPGIEEVVLQELKEVINVNSEIVEEGRVLFEAELEDAKKFVYVTRSSNKVYQLFDNFKFNYVKEIEEKVKKIEFNIKGNFKVKCLRQGSHEFNSQDVEKLIGAIIYKKGYKVNLSSPDTIILTDIIDDVCFLGLDITRKELYKRDYRVKLHTKTINPLIAYAMVRLSGWDKNKTLLDPFSRDGIISIEAAQYALNIPRGFFQDEIKFDEFNKKILRKKLNIFCYDSLMQNLKTCEIHAKLAEVIKYINLGRYDIEWLDTKFKKNEIDFIVTQLPYLSMKRDQSKVKKLITEFFNQAEFILDKKGKIVIFTPIPEIVKKYAKKFKIIDEKDIVIGDHYFLLMILVKS